MNAVSYFVFIVCLFGITLAQRPKSPRTGPYKPNWDSLDARPLPNWYDEAKVGIFLHWGVFSVPSFGSEWFWWFWKGAPQQKYADYMTKNFKPGATYQDFAADFTAEFYNPDQWANIFKASGAKYVVLTSKHHEGFANWPSQSGFSWNAMDVGPKRDLVGDLATAVRKHPDLRFGIYHSLFEWYNPIFNNDKANGYKTQDFVQRKTMPELYELVERYKPDVIWSDGDADASYTYWNSTHFLAWLYNESPVKDTVVTNDRWGNTTCKHGGFFTCDDRYNPGVLQPRKWENAMTIDYHSWGFRREAALADYMNMEELIALLVGTVACGGNLLVNVGPTKDGRIDAILEERLRQMGSWLDVNGEAIYSSKPWTFQNDTITPGVWYTSKTQKLTHGYVENVYAMLTKWPKGSEVTLGAVANPGETTKITMLGYSSTLKWKVGPSGELIVTLPQLTPDLIPCQWAWVLKIEI